MRHRRSEHFTRFSSGASLARGCEQRSQQIVTGGYHDDKTGRWVTQLQGTQDVPRRAYPARVRTHCAGGEHE